jgi:cell surface protein SprA
LNLYKVLALRSSRNVFISSLSVVSFFTIVWAAYAEISPAEIFFNFENGAINPTNSPASFEDTIPGGLKDTTTLPYPFNDKSWDPFPEPGANGPLFLQNPSNIQQEFYYDPETGHYDYRQKMGELDYRSPVYMTFEEYVNYRMDKSTKDYWRQRVAGETINKDSPIIPKIHVGGEAFDRIFGGNTVDIRPQGTAELIFGIMSNRIENPAIPERNRRQTAFDFDQRIQLNVIGNIGEKMKLTTNYNTQATFDFENQMKLEYTGYEDEIIKKIEAGNVNLPLTGSLITGSQSLFGIKTQMQFGKLTVTSVFSQQKGQKQEVESTGGAQTSYFDISADAYEFNRHFFLAHYFRDSYDRAMANLPIILSTINVTRVEVWVTNVNISSTSNIRNVVAFQDLGETNPYHLRNRPAVGTYPNNNVNPLYERVSSTPQVRGFRQANSYLAQQENMDFAIDFDVAEGARLLTAQEYTFHPQLGFISLNQQLTPDQVLAVAFQYTVGGSETVYQVGEFSTDGVSGENAIILKLLKSTNLNSTIPMWDLMMKNIYSIGAYSINRDGFKLDVMYTSIEQGNNVPYISEGAIAGVPLIQVIGLDRLNQQEDRQPDGVFDFLPGRTINPANGRIYFPVIEPFGSHLRRQIANDAIANRFVFQPLYDTIRIAAMQRPDLNRFRIRGSYQSSSSSEISLNSTQLTPGSVTVTAGGVPLVEGRDYTVDYTFGKVKIINQSLLESNTPIKASIETNQLFAIQTRSLFGTHFDYRVSKDFTIGATIMNLTERPLAQKVNIGDEPMSNTIWGMDANYRTESTLLTRIIDKIPLISTKEKSTITFQGEFAHLIPGNSRAIGREGVSYIDDFEGTQSLIDIRSAFAWSLASTPQKQPDVFPEGNLINDLSYGFNRARMAWYTIDPSVFFRNNASTPRHIAGSPMQSNHYMREVIETEIFSQREFQPGQLLNMPVLDVAFYPREKGPYNYDVAPSLYSSGIDQRGLLVNPSSRWGGIMRRIDQNDFETANIEFIQFWLMDPFHPDNGIDQSGQINHRGGDLFFNLGNISEDILRDDRKSFEHGLPTSATITNVDTTKWGRVPTLQSLVNAFDNDPATRIFQDIGYDGLNDADEASFFNDYLAEIAALYGTNSAAYQQALADPSSDNFRYYRGGRFDEEQRNVLERYKYFNNPENNSVTPENSPDPYPTAGTNLPNVEDINRDNTLSTNESYYQYRVSIRPEDLEIGKNYITDKVRGQGKLANNDPIDIDWYQFKIPIRNPEKIVGGIQDFTSIRFIRMYMAGFSDSIICRFGRLELVRGEWRKYLGDLRSPGEYLANDGLDATLFDVGAVNIEENSSKEPVNYVIPPGIDRVIDIGSPQLRRLNEQALVLKVCDLQDGDSRAAFRNTNLDVRSYKRLRMFVHAQAMNNQVLNNGDLTVFIRLGRDYEENYYEYEVPLVVTPPGTYTDISAADRYKVWPLENEIDLLFEEITSLKLERDRAAQPLNVPYTKQIGNKTLSVVGNPQLSALTSIIIGIRNPRNRGDLGDDGFAKCAEIWVNELRLTDFDKNNGWAATSRVTAQLADLGDLNLSGNMSTPGFGSIERKISDRQREHIRRYDISANIRLNKFMPERWNISLPMFVGFSEGFITPQFHPNNPDIEFKEVIRYWEQFDRNTGGDTATYLRQIAQDYTRRKSINFANVKKNKGKGATKNHIYDIENVSLTYAYNETLRRDINTEYNITKMYRAGLNYSFNTNPKNIKPFSKSDKMNKNKYLKLLTDFNLNTMPSRLSFTTNVDRLFNEVQIRNTSPWADFKIPALHNKNFIWARMYELRHDISKNLKFDFMATNNARIMEPAGRIDTQEKRDSITQSIRQFGTNTMYNHAMNLNYTLPLNKFPLTDWITVTTRIGSTYDWMRAPFAAENIGNTIKNSQSRQVNGQLNFVNFYNKVPYLKKVNQKYQAKGAPPKPGAKATPPKPLGAPADTLKKNQKDPNKLSIPDRFALIMMSVKNASVTYTQNEGTLLPGYSDSTYILGMNSAFNRPGWGFVLGEQDNNIGQRAIQGGWLRQDSILAAPYSRTMSTNFNGRTNIEPLRDLKIELNFTRNIAFNHSEFLRWDPNLNDPLTGRMGGFRNESRMETGNFSISYITWSTAFANDSALFDQFRQNRSVVAGRLAEERASQTNETAQQAARGYGVNSQEVLLISFLSAYSGADPTLISTNPMPKIPLPNWRITYDGLSKLDFFKRFFKSFTVSHAYRSSYSIGSYTTNLQWREDHASGFTDQTDLQGNFIPRHQIGQISITEQLSPLINIDMTWHSSLLTRVELRRDRNLVFNFTDLRLQENRGNEIIVGAGYRFKNVPFPIRIGPTRSQVKSDLNLRSDLSVRKNITQMRSVVDDQNQPTAGNTIISIKTGADYVLNTRVNIRIFFDKVLTTPVITTSFPTSNTNAGFSIRFTLS